MAVGSNVGVADGKLGVDVGLCVVTGVVVFVETISTRSISVCWGEIFRHPDSRLTQASRMKNFLKRFIDTSCNPGQGETETSLERTMTV